MAKQTESAKQAGVSKTQDAPGLPDEEDRVRPAELADLYTLFVAGTFIAVVFILIATNRL